MESNDPLTLSLEPGPGRLRLDLAALRAAHTLIQGATRAGKSRLIRWLCEQAFGRVQQLILDVEGEYVSLTEKYDYALFSADTPVRPDPDSAPLLVRRLLELGTSAIFDLSELPTPEQQRFTALAAEELVRASPKTPRSVLVVVDEAQRLAPQAGQGEAASTAALRDLANRGLKRGISLLVATQRHSALDAGLRGALTNLAVGGTPPGLDMDTAGKKLGFNAAERRQLADLRPGDFFFLGGAFGDPDGPRRVHLARSGDVQTRHLTAGEARAYTPPPASDAVQSLYEQLGDLPAQADAEAQTLEALKSSLTARNQALERRLAEQDRVIAELRRQLAAPPEMSPAREALLPVATPVTPPAVPVAVQSPDPAATPPPVPSVAVPNGFPAEVPRAGPAEVPRAGPATALSAGEVRRVRDVLAEVFPYALATAQVGALARVPLTPPQAASLVRALRRTGLAEWDGARLVATGRGRGPHPLCTPQQYRRLWARVLGPMATRLLDALAEAGPDGLTWAQWLDRAAYSSGGGQSAARDQLTGAGFAIPRSGPSGKRYHAGESWPREGEAGAHKPLLRLEGGDA